MNQGLFQRYSAIGTLQFHSDTGSISLDCRWEIWLPDTIRIQLYGPLGLRLGDVWVRGEKVEILNYWMDFRESLTLSSLVMRFPGMVALSSVKELCPFPSILRRDLPTIDLGHSKPEQGILVFGDTLNQHLLQLDSKYLIVTRESFYKSSQNPVLEKAYHSYRRIGHSWLPSRIRFSDGHSDRWMEVVFQSIRIQ
jgi:hypothetical protein